MKTAVIWLLVAYCVLKLGSMAQARNPGFRRTDVRLRDRLRAREPGLFLAAFLISVPLALLVNGDVHRSLTRQYDHATACYGRLMALRDRPEFGRYVDDFTVYRQIQAHRDAAFAMAAGLNMQPDAVSRALADRAKAFAARYAALRRQGAGQEMQAEIGLAQRCLRPPAPSDT